MATIELPDESFRLMCKALRSEAAHCYVLEPDYRNDPRISEATVELLLDHARDCEALALEIERLVPWLFVIGGEHKIQNPES